MEEIPRAPATACNTMPWVSLLLNPNPNPNPSPSPSPSPSPTLRPGPADLLRL